MVEPAACFPLGPLIAVGSNAVVVLQHSCHVQQVPAHKSGVSIGKVVLRATRTGVQVGWSGADLPEPARIRLGRDDKAQVLQGV